MNWRVAGLMTVLLLWIQPAAWVQDQRMVIIVNKANPTNSLTRGELRRIFTKQTRTWGNGESVVPVDWDATSAIRKSFSKKVLDRSVEEMKEFWIQQNITQGLNPPSTQRSAVAILRFVASVPGAISYLPAGDADESVKTIKVPGAE